VRAARQGAGAQAPAWIVRLVRVAAPGSVIGRALVIGRGPAVRRVSGLAGALLVHAAPDRPAAVRAVRALGGLRLPAPIGGPARRGMARARTARVRRAAVRGVPALGDRLRLAAVAGLDRVGEMGGRVRPAAVSGLGLAGETKRVRVVERGGPARSAAITALAGPAALGPAALGPATSGPVTTGSVASGVASGGTARVRDLSADRPALGVTGVTLRGTARAHEPGVGRAR
jgi:hypothetical protein